MRIYAHQNILFEEYMTYIRKKTWFCEKNTSPKDIRKKRTMSTTPTISATTPGSNVTKTPLQSLLELSAIGERQLQMKQSPLAAVAADKFVLDGNTSAEMFDSTIDAIFADDDLIVSRLIFF